MAIRRKNTGPKEITYQTNKLDTQTLNGITKGMFKVVYF